jgi:hypothetical protein
VLLRAAAAHPKLDIRYHRENVASDPTPSRRLLTDPDSRALLERTNTLDAQLYAWARDELFPEQIRRFGPGFDRAVEDFRADRRAPARTLRSLASVATRRLVVDPLARRRRARLESRSHGP